MNNKESFFVKILRWLGFFEERHISKSEMCKQAQEVCNHDCNSCAWAEEKQMSVNWYRRSKDIELKDGTKQRVWTTVFETTDYKLSDQSVKWCVQQIDKKKGRMKNKYSLEIEQKLIGRKIVEASVDGFNVRLTLDDGYEFEYNATDGGYSTFSVERKEE